MIALILLGIILLSICFYTIYGLIRIFIDCIKPLDEDESEFEDEDI